MRTLTRAIQRHARRGTPAPALEWVDDEQFEILESGVIADEQLPPVGSADPRIVRV